jgi:chromosome partitioning protein
VIITVASFKGGVGKTTTALHLAAFFAERSPAVLLVDGDPNQSSLQWSKRGQLPFQVCSLMAAPKLAAKAEHVIIDTAGNPDQADLEDFSQGSDLVVFPTTATAMAIDALLNMVASLQGLDAYGVVLTMVDSRKKGTAEAARGALKEMGLPVFQQMIRRLTAFEKAELEGVPVSQVKDRFSGIAWGEYESLGKEIVDSHG